ncbi:MAG TPA: tetratricopeptide repeat protein, partial [Phycisphaerae bacterium]|nr:tetratricopeptide repeat protein [Phycisphaerae bacterium]
LQMAISDASAAAKIGKLANVHAIIYGSVHVAARRERGTKTEPDLLRRTMRTVSYTREYSVVNVNFTMDDINTGRTLAAHAAKGEYDSQADQKLGAAGVGKKLGFGGGELPPLDSVTDRLIAEGVEQFLAKIGPHSVRFVEKLEKGKTDRVKEGNEFAAAKEYADALKRYEQGIEERPDDHGAMFNAALMCEAMGDLEKAEGYYDRALGLKVTEKYVSARKRVRSERLGKE